jgi:simple sugar transport system ATP-binding protein
LGIGSGEIVGVVGENGAGKSTLVGILGGALEPDAGTIEWEGRPVRFRGPRDARAAGIGVVHQHDSHISRFTVAENLGIARGLPTFPNGPELAAAAREAAARFGLDPGDPNEPVERLSVGARQRLEILKALCRPTKLLLLDEPTAALAPAEVDELLEVVRRLRDAGVSLVLIDHKLHEVMEACARVVVLRRGKVVSELETARSSARELAAAMVGHPIDAPRRPAPPRGAAALTISQLSTDPERGSVALRGVSLTVAAGEIVGIAGVDGNGQRELVEAIVGLRKPAAGSIRGGPIGAIAPDRREEGLVLDLSLEENLVLDSAVLREAAPRGILAPAALRARAAAAIERFRIAAPGPAAPARALSGGNQQKIVVARALARRPAVLVAASPTRGLDVDAAAAVRGDLLGFAEAGGAVLLVSADLDEIGELCHRAYVLSRGAATGPFPVPFDAPTLSAVGVAMAGGRA